MYTKAKYIFMLFVLTIFLTGCISIPIGDKVLEISEAGISYTTSGESDDGQVDGEGSKEVTGFSFGGQLPEEFPDDIYFPEDAEIINVFEMEGDSQKDMTVQYKVEEDRQTKLLDIYREYVQENDLEIFIDGEDPEGVGQQLSAMIKDGPSFMANVQIENGDSIVKVKYIKRW